MKRQVVMNSASEAEQQKTLAPYSQFRQLTSGTQTHPNSQFRQLTSGTQTHHLLVKKIK